MNYGLISGYFGFLGAIILLTLIGSIVRYVCIVIILVGLLGRYKKWEYAILVSVIASICYVAVIFFWYRQETSHISALPPQESTGTIEKQLSDSRYVLSSHNKSYILHTTNLVNQELYIGDRVRVRGNHEVDAFYHKNTVRSLPEQRYRTLSYSYERRRQLAGYAGDIRADAVQPLGYSVDRSFITELRVSFRDRLIGLYGTQQEAGLLAGMLIGDTSLLSDEIENQFRSSGLAHIVAVSGGNVFLVIVFLGIVLRWVPFYGRVFVLILGVILYGALCGFDASVSRAVISAVLTLFILYWGRVIDSRRVIAISAFVLLLWRPYALLYDVGFQLSYAAVIGIVLFSQMMEQIGIYTRRLYRFLFRDILVPLIGATIGVFPILIVQFGEIGSLILIANFLVTCAIPLIMIGGLVSLYIPLFVPGVTVVLQYVLGVSSRIASYTTTILFTQWQGIAIGIARWCLLCGILYQIYCSIMNKKNHA